MYDYEMYEMKCMTVWNVWLHVPIEMYDIRSNKNLFVETKINIQNVFGKL